MALPDLTPEDWEAAAKRVIDYAAEKLELPALQTLASEVTQLIIEGKEILDALSKQLKAINDFIAKIKVSIG